MPKKSTSWLIVMLSMLLPLVAACGTGVSTGTSLSNVSVVVPHSENLYVLDGYSPLGTNSNGQQIVAFHPGSANPAALLTLPTGLTSMDHRTLYTATSKGGQTTVSVINTQSGSSIRSLVIQGNYTTTGRSFANAVLSFNGQWLALRELGQASNETTIALVDTQSGKLVKTIRLNGNFDLDAVNPDGSRIFLLEKLNDGSGHYYVRLYDVTENQLYQYPIVDKTEINDPRMTGTALARQMASDGTMVYTLYIDIARNVAFVHILPLTGDLLGARCVVLPAGKSADLLHYYTLTLSSDGTTLYAANGALGVASAIELSGADIFDDKIAGTSRFNPGNTNAASGDKTQALYNGAALSPDQKTLYFVGQQGVWAINTSDLLAQRNNFAHYLTRQSLTGIALSTDGQTLYAVDPANGITLLNAGTGQPQQVIQGPAHAPWGIVWITN